MVFARVGLKTGASFDSDGAVDDENHYITIIGHSFKDGDAVRYSAEGDDENIGLAEGVIYYVDVIDADTIRLMSDQALNNVVTISGTTPCVSNAQKWVQTRAKPTCTSSAMQRPPAFRTCEYVSFR